MIFSLYYVFTTLIKQSLDITNLFLCPMEVCYRFYCTSINSPWSNLHKLFYNLQSINSNLPAFLQHTSIRFTALMLSPNGEFPGGSASFVRPKQSCLFVLFRPTQNFGKLELLFLFFFLNVQLCIFKQNC